MKIYKVAEIILCVSNKICFNKAWEIFEINNREKCNIDIYVSGERIKKCHYNDVDIFPKIYDDEYLVRINRNFLILNKEYSKFRFILPINQNTINSIIEHLFCDCIIRKHGLQLHSSLISTNDHGLMFLGPSGIGKTTQAELWNKYRDALIINGDIVFVQETEDAFLGWGTPWHGSSPYCENTSVPVHAMIVLKQAPENSIRELTGFEKVSEVSNSVFYPRWLENGMELCLETLDHLLSKIPVYELSCRPDEDAVRLVEETVFK